ncbi:hypothetical protein [Plantactinospora sp. KLBMP9567]|uniref:hypothetical protein n=1 Tax=Plantactinospora sp. KLBMP9567 TaxID=3085900 RepID=UPI002981BB94|nr:hypothetical protein [Plantactinospora sp. KLBMP9567]MDW5329254.1 hypothetical protein [Plantactinospora sp. KLBMP9567]
MAYARDEVTLRSVESCNFASYGSPVRSRCSSEVIHQEKCWARQIRRSAVSE